jgi:hypothetical protein
MQEMDELEEWGDETQYIGPGERNGPACMILKVVSRRYV